MFRFPSFIDARIWNCILLFQVAIRISRKDLSSVSGEYSKKIQKKSFDIFGTIKTIGLRERIHSHDQSKREVFSTSISYKEEIHFIIRSKLYRFPYVFLKEIKQNKTTTKKRRKDIFAVWAVLRKVASADNHSIFYRACAKFVTRFASKINCWFSVSRHSK